MKRSNFLLILLSSFLMIGLLATDYLLAKAYRKINLADPFKNFETVPVKPFTLLKLSGGNSYAVKLVNGERFDIRLLKSRKSFFNMKTSGDTLDIHFSVANQRYQLPEQCVTGLIITVPQISKIKLSGVNVDIRLSNKKDTLWIEQDKNSNTRLRGLNIKTLYLTGNAESVFDCVEGNRADIIHLELSDHASIRMKEFSFRKLMPDVKEEASVVMFKKSLQAFDTANNKTDSIVGRP